MKVFPFFSAAMALLIVFTPHARAEDNLYFHGELVAEPCVIPPGSEIIPLDFGTVIDKYLYSYQRTLPVSLAIQLAECDLSLGQSLTVTFVGSENGSLPGYLALDTGSQARGVAIGLESMEGKSLPLNKRGEKISLVSGNNQIRLQAYIRGEPLALQSRTIVRGDFSAAVTFNLEYE
ncbi:fimbrial protein [Serratia marcescens]|uniref:fimbrial protein n=1 Tax=Serratia TaxID=613 RepID=UPI0007456892|nr:fimbrial protein [Serratia marcescens]EGS5644153.1 type 1 fimbrial protein [Serratia marcescens]EIJ9189709.1 type 1 fimbrial protein [Serratia marcescens]ELH4210403.1 type 1 fimbrial protein [Serratia marcescens]MBH2523253.1 type 1 fimbrial protein [Serratia marcescens]MBH2571292.1 type 1 fimbrial protein [Serratia marcescens]